MLPCDGEVTLTGLSGYLSGIIARKTGYGSERCPWVVRAPAGQHIELTVYDFGLDAASVTAGVSGSSASSVGSTVASSAGTGSQQRQLQQPHQQNQRPQKQTSAQVRLLADVHYR
jgi:hypothetical protein